VAKYRVAVEHINTHKTMNFDVEAKTMSEAAARGLQACDRETSDEHYLFEVVSVWRMNLPFWKKHRKGKR
jgi:hypothetical protein